MNGPLVPPVGTMPRVRKGQGMVRQNALRIHEIFVAAAREFGFTIEQLRGEDRRASTVLARHTAMIRCVQAGCSLSAVGRYCGDRDHTTVRHAVLRMEARLAGKVHSARVRNDRSGGEAEGQSG